MTNVFLQAIPTPSNYLHRPPARLKASTRLRVGTPPSHTSDLIYNQIRRFISTLTSTPSPKPSNSPRSAIPPTSKLLENFPDNLYPGAPPSSSRLIPEPRPTSPPSNLPRPAASNQRFYLNSSSHSRSPSILSSSSPSLLPRLFMFYLNPDSQPHTLPSQL